LASTWSTLVGKPYVGVYTMIEELQKVQQRVDLEIECINRGEPKPKQKKQIIDSIGGYLVTSMGGA